MKVNWQIPTAERNYNRVQASIWIRCLQLIPHLSRLGVESVINEERSNADFAYFVRWQDEEACRLAREAKQRGTRVLFDLVVNYYHASPLVRGAGTNPEQVVECRRMTETADAITTCSQEIAQWAGKYHRRVFYLPDSIDPVHFRLHKDPADFGRKPLRLIWSGVATKLRELEPILNLIRSFGFELVVVSNRAVALPGISSFLRRGYRFIKWRYESFPSEILRGDVCISYRDVESSYNRGHSHFKIGVMMAQGLPAIASPVPAYREVIEESAQSCGWICETLTDWREAFTLISDDPAVLLTRSQAARRRMLRYSTDQLALRYVEMLASLRNGD